MRSQYKNEESHSNQNKNSMMAESDPIHGLKFKNQRDDQQLDGQDANKNVISIQYLQEVQQRDNQIENY